MNRTPFILSMTLVVSALGCTCGPVTPPQPKDSATPTDDAAPHAEAESTVAKTLHVEIEHATKHETNTATLALVAATSLQKCTEALDKSIPEKTGDDPAAESTETVRPPGPAPQDPPSGDLGPPPGTFQGRTSDPKPSILPPGMNPGTMPPGMKPGMMPEGMMPGMMPAGMKPGMMPPGMKPGMMPPGMKPGMMPPGMKPPPGLRTPPKQQGSPNKGPNAPQGGEAPGDTPTGEVRMDNTTEEPRLEIDGNAIAAACGDFARLYLAHESQLGITYRFDQVLGKFARLGDDVNILLSIIVNDDARSTQEASIKNLRTSMKTLEKALVQWNATAPKTLPSSDSANAPVQSETAAGWKGTALRHLHNARSGRIDSGGTAPKLSDQWTSEVQRILSNDKRGLSDMDKRIQRYGIQTITEPHKIRVLFMRYFGTIHRHRLAAHQRRFANPPPDPALKNIHDLFIQYLDRSEQLLNAYHDAQKLIVAGGLQHKPLEIASVQKNMGDRQQEWARSLTTLNTVMSDLFDPQSK